MPTLRNPIRTLWVAARIKWHEGRWMRAEARAQRHMMATRHWKLAHDLRVLGGDA